MLLLCLNLEKLADGRSLVDLWNAALLCYAAKNIRI